VNWGEWHFADDSAKRNLARLIREAAEEFGVDVLAEFGVDVLAVRTLLPHAVDVSHCAGQR